MTAEEWRLRCELAACFQLTDLYGMSDVASTHISVVLPGPEHHFLVNPLGTLFDPATTRAINSKDYVREPFPGNIIPASRFNATVIIAALLLRKTDQCPACPRRTRNWRACKCFFLLFWL